MVIYGIIDSDTIQFHLVCHKEKKMKPPRIVIHALILILASGMVVEGVQGQLEIPTVHLKKTNPNELYVLFSQLDDCEGSYEQVVNNELVQSRIKRAEDWEINELLLIVDVICMPLDITSSIIYDPDVKFGGYRLSSYWQPNEFTTLERYVRLRLWGDSC